MPKQNAEKPVTHAHTLTFSGQVPADEGDRAQMHVAINDARKALTQAFADAGHPHTSESHVTRPRVRKDKPAEGESF